MDGSHPGRASNETDSGSADWDLYTGEKFSADMRNIIIKFSEYMAWSKGSCIREL